MYLKYSDLLKKGFRPAQNKLFMLSRDGCKVYRQTPMGYSPARIYKHRYSTVPATIDGKQKMFILHRLMAEAFIKNPDNLPVVLHRDNNNHNNHADNLFWATNETRLRRAIARGGGNTISNSGVKCPSCGELTLSRQGICCECQKIERKKISERKKREVLSEALKNVDTKFLSARDRKILLMRSHGKTLREIGLEFGLAGESVRQIIKRAGKQGKKNELTEKISASPDYDLYISSLEVSKFLRDTHINLALIARETGLNYQRLYGKVVRRGCFEKEELSEIKSYLYGNSKVY